MGEYIGRVYDEVRHRPLSIISKVYAAGEAAYRAQPARPDGDEIQRTKRRSGKNFSRGLSQCNERRDHTRGTGTTQSSDTERRGFSH